MDFKEILAEDIANYEQQHGHTALEPPWDESVKTNVDFRRNIQLGQILTEHFPELKCFRPQLNAAANAAEFQPFGDFLDKISSPKSFQTAFKKMIADKLAEQTAKEPVATRKSAHSEKQEED